MKNDRLFQIIYILLERESITAPELARLLEVSIRTVYRDVEALSMAGVPVITSQGRGGGISIMPGYSFNKALLTDEDQNQILFAIQSLQAADQNVDGLLKKLGLAFQKEKANWIEVDFSRWGMRREDNRRFELLRKAILEKIVLHILYCGTNGTMSEREVKPIKLIFKAKNWYLQAFCLKAEDFRLFKVGRIVEVYLTDKKFTEVYTDLPSTDGDEYPPFTTASVKLCFQPSVAFRVYDEFEREAIESMPDGSLCVSADFPLDSWVYSYLYSFGTEVEILEPTYLKKQIVEYAKKIYEHHKT